jgi:hypothetical protein
MKKPDRFDAKTRAFCLKRIKEAKSQLKVLEARREKRSFTAWAEWYAMDYVRWEATLAHWEDILAGIENIAKDQRGKWSNEQVLDWLIRVRDDYVKDAINSFSRHSTSQMANMIEAEKQDVVKRVAGHSCMSADSLLYLITSLKMEK